MAVPCMYFYTIEPVNSPNNSCSGWSCQGSRNATTPQC